MVDYVNKAFNRQSDVEYEWHLDQTILKSMTDSRIESTGTFFNEVSYNSISADFFDYDNWVGQAKVVDMRDKMRKRGWTYLEINGEYDGRKVTGRGRIPFTYNMKQQYQPWLDIEIEDTARIIDCNNIAAIQTKSGDRYFKSGTFFIGLHKPWQGYRVEEAVARDAIRCGADISRFMSNVRVDYKKDGGTVEIYYMLSGNENLIKMITIKNGNKQGRLMLTYHQDIDNPDGQFIQPEAELPEGVNVLSGNVNWLVDVLADKDGLASYPPKAEKTIEDEQVVMDELRKQLRKCRPPMY
jgi:hypothetical protein